ncbi:MAG: response regulator [Elusimicrobia bacterium]|jgi:two-component system cell cycle response regulator DivK|nr:response regulator [Elusimicrobiota bacterium]
MKILIIEDNEFNMEIARTVLEKEGYDTIAAVDGKEGLEKVKESPDIILLDLSLPKISGEDVVRAVRKDKDHKDIPVIALTAHAMEGDREKALEAGCSSYLSKPCLPKDIVAEVKKYIS